MAYRALYRQYRPTRFEDVIGQAHITTTLINQVTADRPAHAYLFCGTRGTGKTTTARILARAVNCLASDNGEPCGSCAACREMQNESMADITEIDAASNNGVDNVRDLIESVQYAPLYLRKRVFIIDEVHMLTGAAFNALLKTLEEPPAHVLFILATTEPQKLPATIVSRCQRFDFHRLSVKDIKATLNGVLRQAGASVDDDGLTLIARAAQGGMRDALSLLDQCLAFCGDHVTTQNVYDVLGGMDEAFLFDMADALLQADAPRALRLMGDVVDNGRDLTVFCADLAGHFRALLLAKTCGQCEDMLDCTRDAMTRYIEQSGPVSQALLLLAVDRLLKAHNDMRYLPAPRALLESAMIGICRPEGERSFAALEARLDRLEQRVQTAPIAPGAYEPPAPTQTREKTDPPMQATETAPAPQDEAPATQKHRPAKKRPAQAQQQKAAEAPDANGAQEAAAVWRAAIAAIPNFFVQTLAHEARAIRLQDGVLTVGYTQRQETMQKSLLAPVNLNPVLAALNSVRPDTKLTVMLMPDAPASTDHGDGNDGGDDATAMARALFGDKLTIE